MPRAAYDMVSVYVFRRTVAGAEFLLLRRRADDYMGGTWQPVYGSIRAGETATHAALRELAEETGLRPVRLYHSDSIVIFYIASKDTVYHCPAFVAEAATDAAVKLNKEHDAFEWVAAKEAVGRLMWPGQRQVAREIIEEIITPGPATPYLEIAIV
jgi:8-oxo-dGTP diphosphatase